MPLSKPSATLDLISRIAGDRSPLSPKERGVYITLLFAPDDWEPSIEALRSLFGKAVGITAVSSAITSLEDNGLLLRKRIRDSKGASFTGTEWFLLPPEK